MNIVFMGTAEFSLKALKALYENHFNVVAVYTREPKPSGRKQEIHKSIVHEFAESKNIPVFTPKSLKAPEQFEQFVALKADLAVVSSYGLIIPQNILDAPKYGFINIHASLLPRWRGAAPIQAAILEGDEQTGITIMKMNAGLDTGDIISTESLPISPKTTHGELAEAMGNLGAKMIINTINDLEQKLSNAVKQNENDATYVSKITKESCKINWNNSAKKILRQIMAFSPIPAAWSEIGGMRIKVLDADLAQIDDQKHNSGEIFAKEENMLVACTDGTALILEKVQPAGKNPMSGAEFLRGRKNLVGKVFS